MATVEVMDTKRAILGAAKQLLWRVGYEGMSPKRLLNESGAGQGSLYHHFRGKKAVAIAALEEVEREMVAEFTALIRGPADPMEAIRLFLTAPRRGGLGCRIGRLVNETAFDDFTLRAPLERFFTEIEASLSARVAEAQSSGRLDPTLDPDRLATLLTAVVQGGFALSRARRSDAPLAEACSAAWALLQRARPGRGEGGET